MRWRMVEAAQVYESVGRRDEEKETCEDEDGENHVLEGLLGRGLWPWVRARYRRFAAVSRRCWSHLGLSARW